MSHSSHWEGTVSKVIAFVCSHCSLSGAESAGTKRIQYPADVQLIRVACSGQVDETIITNAFKSGADGVIVFGCPDGDCHYEVGNQLAKQRIRELKSMLPAIGFDEKRLEFVQVGASDGEKFVEAVKKMFANLEEVGPSPLTRTGGKRK